MPVAQTPARAVKRSVCFFMMICLCDSAHLNAHLRLFYGVFCPYTAGRAITAADSSPPRLATRASALFGSTTRGAAAPSARRSAAPSHDRKPSASTRASTVCGRLDYRYPRHLKSPPSFIAPTLQATLRSRSQRHLHRTSGPARRSQVPPVGRCLGRVLPPPQRAGRRRRAARSGALPGNNRTHSRLSRSTGKSNCGSRRRGPKKVRQAPEELRGTTQVHVTHLLARRPLLPAGQPSLREHAQELPNPK